MIIDLTDKNAIVTGSTAGIGFAIATGLARAGASVTITGRTENAVNAAVQAILNQQPNARVAGVAADLASPEGAATLTCARPDTDILVNNLGIYGAKPLFDLTDEDWTHILDVNVTSAARLSRHYAPGMQARNWGRLLFITSESALNIPPEMVHYGVSKAAMQALARGYAKVLSGTGVTSNAILPGPTRTENAVKFIADLANQRGISTEEMEALFIPENRPTSILQRFATPEEVANLCVYVASPLASATTGAALRVEGGIVEGIG